MVPDWRFDLMALSHSPRIVTDGLVLCLDAANKRSYPGAGTTWTDLSSSKANGTLVNMTNNFSTDGAGGLTLDGTNEYVKSDLVLGDANTSFTLSVWIKLTSLNGSNSLVVFSNYGLVSTTSLYAVVANDANNPTSVRFDARSSTNVLVQSSSINIPDNTTFNYMTIVRDSSNDLLYLYVNNTSTSVGFLGSYDMRSTGSNNGSIFVGRHLNTYVQGSTSSIVAYNRVLSAEEIKQNYLATKGRYA
jgi:hypothetical protein